MIEQPNGANAATGELAPPTDDEIFLALEQAVDAGEEIMEVAIGLGQRYRMSEEDGKYNQGDLACLVEKRYGKNAIKDFAKSIGKEVDRIKEYRTVCRQWKRSARAEILTERPNLTYSHLRTAGRFIKDDGDSYGRKHAMRILDMAAKYTWSAEKTRIKANRLLGKPVPPVKILDAVPCAIAGPVGQDAITFRFAPDVARRLRELYFKKQGLALAMTLA